MQKIAVFSRNHKEHLEKAAKCPGKFFNFQSHERFSSVKKALKYQNHVNIYLAVLEKGSQVQYRGRIVAVLFEDDIREHGEENIVRDLIEPSEGIWGETVYRVGDLREVEEPFNMTDLVKVSGGKSIHADYGYGYSVVYDPERQGR